MDITSHFILRCPSFAISKICGERDFGWWSMWLAHTKQPVYERRHFNRLTVKFALRCWTGMRQMRKLLVGKTKPPLVHRPATDERLTQEFRRCHFQFVEWFSRIDALALPSKSWWATSLKIVVYKTGGPTLNSKVSDSSPLGESRRHVWTFLSTPSKWD